MSMRMTLLPLAPTDLVILRKRKIPLKETAPLFNVAACNLSNDTMIQLCTSRPLGRQFNIALILGECLSTEQVEYARACRTGTPSAPQPDLTVAHYYSDTEGIVAEVIRRRLHEHIVYDHNFPLTQDERQRHLDNVTLANTLSPIELDEQSLNTIIIGEVIPLSNQEVIRAGAEQLCIEKQTMLLEFSSE